MLHARVAHSEDPDSRAAAHELVAELQPALDEHGSPRLLFVWAAIDVDHAYLLNALCDACPDALLAGCTTDGEVASALGFVEDSVVVMALWSDALDVGVGVGRAVSEDPQAAARSAVAQARAKLEAPPSLALTFPESLTTSGVAVVDALVAELGPKVVTLGATSADQHRYVGTRQFVGREVLSDALPVVLLGGAVRFGHGVASGWSPLGREAVITRAESNIVYEVDGQPALQFYRTYFGPEALPVAEQPLAVFVNGGDKFYLRAPLSADEDSGAVTFLGDVPVGARVQLTDVDRDSIIAAVGTSVESALVQMPEQPAAALVFSCAGRRTMLGTRSAEEQAELRRSLPGVPFAGFYGYGEIGPLAPGGRTRYHNETFITVLLGA